MTKSILQSGVSSAAIGIIVAIVVLAGFIGYTMLSRSSDETMVTETDTMETGDSMMNDSVLEGDTETRDESMRGDDSMQQDEMMDSVQVIEVEGGAFYYEPDEITVKKGDTVKIVLTSADMMHDFVIDELNVASPVIESGDTGEVTFTATEAGEYEFYCSVGEHRAKGMVGTLIVEE